jgi:hypothetical protein
MTEQNVVPDSPARITATRVVALFAADHAVVAPDGKMYVNGGFVSVLRFPSFPATLPTLGMAAVLELPFQDTMQDRALRLGLRGPEGQDLPVRVEAQFRTAPSLEMRFGDPGQVPFAVTVTNIEIPVPGEYKLVLWLDGTEMASYSIRAIQTPMMPSFLNTTPPRAS